MSCRKYHCMAVLVLLLVSIQHIAFAQAVSIRDDREIFVDKQLIAATKNINHVLHHPVSKGKVFDFDKPWEGAFSGYGTVIKDGSTYKMYYRGVNIPKDGSNEEVYCVAESQDGISWKKPELGLFVVNGTRKNNVILANAAPVTHNFCPFLDTNPEAKPGERYKAIGGDDKTGLSAYVSPDGLNWKKMPGDPVFPKGQFDSQNVPFWSSLENRYVFYFRTWAAGAYKGFRTVSRSTSKDFINWSPPEFMEFGDTPLEHLYTQQTSPYYRAPHIYLAIGARFMPNRQVVSDSEARALGVDTRYYKDCSDAILMSSRGGNQYDRTFMESFIRPGIGVRNWVSRSNYPVLNVVQTGEEEMSIYVNEDYAQPTAHVKRYALRIDGFASLNANYGGGEVLTRLLIFEGGELEINYATSAAGSIQIELQDKMGVPVPGFTLQDSPEIIGNEIKRIVRWKGGHDLSKLSGVPLRLRFVMKDADLYSFKFNKN